MRTTRFLIFLASLAAIVALANFVLHALRPPAPMTVGFPAIDAAAVLQHTKVLSSAEFEGRAPATPGEGEDVPTSPTSSARWG